jgi:Tfp pilus assembly protein PilO
MAEDTKKSVDMKNLDVKDIGALLKGAGGNPTALFIVFAFLVSFLLSYLIYGMIDNQSLYDQEQAKYNETTIKIASLTKKFDKTIKANKVYFTQLFSSPKTEGELSARITKLVSNYNLKLVNIDLQKKIKGKLAISLEVSGGYINLVKFSKELNKNVAASQVIDLETKKKTQKSKGLNMKVTLTFAAPPDPSSIPKLKAATVSIVPNKSFADNTKEFFNTILSWVISPSYAHHTNMSLFQEALHEAKKQGLYDFEFTNKAGRTMLYTTGIPKSEALVPSQQKKMTAFQEALHEAKKQGLYDFEFTNKAGRTMRYVTGIPKTTIAALPQIEALPELDNLPPLQAYDDTNTISEVMDSSPQLETKIITENDFDSSDLKRTGFVESDPFSGSPKDNSNAPAEETVQAAPAQEALRDPFAPPEVRKAVKRSGSGLNVSEEEEDQYYLSGVLVSDEMSLCIIITPDGESKIYAPGDKISNKVMLTNIAFDSIQINKLNKKKVVGLGEQVN